MESTYQTIYVVDGSGIACMPWANVPTLVLIVLTELSPSIKWTIEKKWLQGTLLISNANRMWDWTTTTPTTTADRYGAIAISMD